MKNISIFIAFAIATVIATNAYADPAAEAAYAEARSCYNAVKSEGADGNDRGAWERCISMFEQVKNSHPKDKRAPDALFSAARLRRELYESLHEKTDIEEAIRLYNLVIKEYSASSLADDSLYYIACLRHKPLREDERARKALEYQIATYPKGDMTPKAKRLLATLGGPTESSGIAAEEFTPGDAAEEKAEGQKTEKSVFAADVATPFDGAMLTNIDIADKPESTVVDLKFTQPVAYSIEFTELGRRTKSQPRLELVLSHAEPSESLAKELSVNSPYLDHIKLSKRILGSGSRLIFTMAPDATYDVIPKGPLLNITFRRSDGGVPPATAPLTPAKPGGKREVDAKKKAPDSD